MRSNASVPLHRHFWDTQDGLDLKDFRASLDRGGKQQFSEIQGELLGHRYAEDILGYQEVFHGDEKSIRQGLDGIYFDPETDSLVVVEFKGQKSPESELQKQPSWVMDTCRKIEHRQRPYQQVSEHERGAAQMVLQHLEKGQPVRYEVIRTEVDSINGQCWSQLEKQTLLEQELTYEPPTQGLGQDQQIGMSFF